MYNWYQSDEFEMPLWVLDLDDDTWSVHHRRLCVWSDEFDGSWHWEIQTYDHGGVAARAAELQVVRPDEQPLVPVDRSNEVHRNDSPGRPVERRPGSPARPGPAARRVTRSGRSDSRR